MKQQMILIRGLPGSGKTTLARLIATSKRFYWQEADNFFLNSEGDYLYDNNKIKEAHDWCKKEIAEALKENISVIISNTFTQLWEMKPYLIMAKAYNIEPLVIEIKGQWQNTHNVPQEVIENMKQRWESYP